MQGHDRGRFKVCESEGRSHLTATRNLLQRRIGEDQEVDRVSALLPSMNCVTEELGDHYHIVSYIFFHQVLLRRSYHAK
jgi:hypothetical protein